MFQPLKGKRVIDLSQVLAGPYATYLLALMGAEVIKIEKPGEGDWTRSGGPDQDLARQKMAVNYLTQNGAKKSVTIDLKKPEGRALVLELAAGADVFLENFKPGVANRLGLDFAAVRAANPAIVYCSISAFGQSGPFSPRPAYDHIIQGMCGIMQTTGMPGNGPTKVGAPYVDYATGMNAAMAVMAGLMEVQRTSEAVQIDVAMLDTALLLMASLMTQHLTTGWVPAQNGNEAWSASPSSGAFETAEGTLMLAANNDRQFRQLCDALNRADISTDPRWKTSEARGKNAADLRSELNAIFVTRGAAEWEDLLARFDVPAGRVRTLDEILDEDHIRARGLLHVMKIADSDRPIHVPSLSFQANGSAPAPLTPPPALGADTDEVLSACGIPLERIAALRAAGVL
ncbi:CaiB/BaiF CoA transferase family protein [Roseibium marinum]|uniref:Crotonobetainyl-CoA:carnitine CoA-transferase CaiB-like acyl-CoA transferase n=1 Tax=Roseibium marinum TaxID=281252 RepID=A0A2S3V4U6_9HYPH|nr:CoA transferase [Roseibium marinum]POF34900.1 crotonobetainyl-CoA:carnitine CoA-transferase CaiB-like acyl-CoA transferase [Roseibium marinum]